MKQAASKLQVHKQKVHMEQSASAKDDNVVDAEFEEVKEDK